MKVYSAERVPNSVDYNLYVTDGNSKVRLLLQEPKLPALRELPAQDRVLRCLSFTILLNYTDDAAFASSNSGRFLNYLEDIIHRDSWFFLANRVEQFIKEFENFGVEISYDF
ncbi:hypothetical protein EHO61_17050 [Leptospira fluminis]|uniref:Uncharacterized protein n=1 Tax=Leptospira fluminis TaxID=2484979 RepID=A0A4R9GLP5_9LEPT|nr:hypothetical protein [Leptospira fluminis]TGK14775.1 hypothetical protein EHO61_17050 [Leptospira fluminis]